jgi:hypothetical protein
MVELLSQRQKQSAYLIAAHCVIGRYLQEIFAGDICRHGCADGSGRQGLENVARKIGNVLSSPTML